MTVNPKLTQPLRLAGGNVGCLMVHGFTSCPADVRPLSKHLHRCGFSVHELLLPGHGTSFQDLAQYGWQDWLKAVESGLLELKSQCSSVWLAGFSMGGVLAILAASRHQVDGLVSISAPIWPRPKRTKYACILKYFQKYAQLGQPSEFRFPSWRYEQVAVKNIADLMHLIKLAKRALPAILVPTLVVQGEDDHTIEPRSAKSIFDALGTEDKELFFLGCGHMVLLEASSMEVSKKVSDFILIRTGGKENGCC